MSEGSHEVTNSIEDHAPRAQVTYVDDIDVTIADRERKLPSRARVVIVGGGFAGLHAARGVARLPVDVTLIDRRNHHTFQPLLYQVALGVLSPAHIAQPLRALLRKHLNVTVIMDEAVGFDLPGHCVHLNSAGAIEYDYLMVATGATHSYFGNDEWARLAPGLKSIDDAIEIRRRLIMALESAEVQMLNTGNHAPLNFVVVGGGPTGVELAGAISDICKNFMQGSFRLINPAQARVILLEGSPRILASYPEDLSQKALTQLRKLGVEVQTNARVTDIQEGYLMLGSQRVDTAVTLWGAGVQASPAAGLLGTEVDKRGRVIVDDHLNPAGYREVFVCGDMARVTEFGREIPGVAQPAMQMGDHVARMIGQDLSGKPRTPFHYFDKGDMSTIGRYAAVAKVEWPFKAHWSGMLAWLSWLAVHVFFLISFRNRVSVLAEWLYSMVTSSFGACLVTGNTSSQSPSNEQDRSRLLPQRARSSILPLIGFVLLIPITAEAHAIYNKPLSSQAPVLKRPSFAQPNYWRVRTANDRESLLAGSSTC